MALFDELDVTARLYVPSFGNAAAERGISTHVPELTLAMLPSDRPNAGCVFQLTVVSVQSLDTRNTCPPILLGSMTYNRSVAVLGLRAIPVTSNWRRNRYSGVSVVPARTWTLASVP